MIYNSSDLFNEFKLETDRCQSYFDLMYKTLQFTFVAIVALVVCVSKLDVDGQIGKLIFYIAIPICLYVFGIMYTYNAYALTVCGKRAETIHSKLYNPDQNDDLKQGFNKMLYSYVVTSRKVTLIAYGVPWGFYLLAPTSSCLIGWILFAQNSFTFLEWFAIFCLIVYYVLIIIIIHEIAKDFFAIDKIQSKATGGAK